MSCHDPDCILLAGHGGEHQIEPRPENLGWGTCHHCEGPLVPTGTCFTCRRCGESTGCS